MIGCRYILGMYYDYMRKCISHPVHYCEILRDDYHADSKEDCGEDAFCLPCNAMYEKYLERIVKLVGEKSDIGECNTKCAKLWYRYAEYYVIFFREESKRYIKDSIEIKRVTHDELTPIARKNVTYLLTTATITPCFMRLDMNERIKMIDTLVALFDPKVRSSDLEDNILKSACNRWFKERVINGNDNYSMIIKQAVEKLNIYLEKEGCNIEKFEQGIIDIIIKSKRFRKKK